MTLCHTCLIKAANKELNLESTLISESPDEEALVDFAKFCGMVYQGFDEDKTLMKVDFQGKQKNYKRIAIFEFSSER